MYKNYDIYSFKMVQVDTTLNLKKDLQLTLTKLRASELTKKSTCVCITASEVSPHGCTVLSTTADVSTK